MSNEIGTESQIINFNYVHKFISDNTNKFLYKIFNPGVLDFQFSNDSNSITINDFSAFLIPKDTEQLIKVDTMNSFTLSNITDSAKTYLVAYMDPLTPPNDYDYSDVVDHKKLPIACTLDTKVDYIISTGHSLINGDIVIFYTTIGGIDSSKKYYVINAALDIFQISETANGTPIDLIGNTLASNTYFKINNILVYFDVIESTNYDSSYMLLLATIEYIGSLILLITPYSSNVFLSDNCINYDYVQRSGVRGLLGSNVTGISGYTINDIPLSNTIVNVKLNAEYLNGITTGNAAGNIPINNEKLSTNLVAARLFLNSYEYAIGQSGISSYSGFSGYSGISGFSGASGYSAYSGYIPINNNILQTSLNAEYLGGYKYSEFSINGHTHTLDEIADGITYKKVFNVNSNNLLTSESITDKSLDYKHQDNLTTKSWHYNAGNPSKIFMLSGEIGLNGSTTITFRKPFSSIPYVFLVNNETNEIKSVKSVTVNGFIINHNENTKSDGGGNLVSDTTYFTTRWIAVGKL